MHRGRRLECPLLSQFDSPMKTGSGAQVGEASNDRTGWTVGASVEWMFAPNWSAFAEYNFMGFGTQGVNFTGCGGTCVVNANANANVQNVLAGVNYKFNF